MLAGITQTVWLVQFHFHKQIQLPELFHLDGINMEPLVSNDIWLDVDNWTCPMQKVDHGFENHAHFSIIWETKALCFNEFGFSSKIGMLFFASSLFCDCILSLKEESRKCFVLSRVCSYHGWIRNFVFTETVEIVRHCPPTAMHDISPNTIQNFLFGEHKLGLFNLH